jgi:deoxycytidylate deaminase
MIFAPALWNCASMSRFRHLRVLCARSDCLRKQVGAVLVSRDHRIVSTG